MLAMHRLDFLPPRLHDTVMGLTLSIQRAVDQNLRMRHLDHSAATVGVESVRVIVVLKAGIIEIAEIGEMTKRVLRQATMRRPKAAWFAADDARQHGVRALQERPLVDAFGVHLFHRPAMGCDLVPASGKRGDIGRVGVGFSAGHEHRRLDSMTVEEPEQALAADGIGIFAVRRPAEQCVLSQMARFDRLALEIDGHGNRYDSRCHWPLQSRRQSDGRSRHHCASSSMPTRRTSSCGLMYSISRSTTATRAGEPEP